MKWRMDMIGVTDDGMEFYCFPENARCMAASEPIPLEELATCPIDGDDGCRPYKCKYYTEIKND